MKESKIMLIQYVTAIAAIFLVGIHLLMQGVLVPYGTAISFERVLANYRSIVDVALLETLLVVVLLHGFNDNLWYYNDNLGDCRILSLESEKEGF